MNRKPYRVNARVLVPAGAVAFTSTAGLAWLGRGQIAAFFHGLLRLFEQREAVREFVLSFGSLAPAVYVALQALQVVLSPIPGEATGLLGGFFFGAWMGFVYGTLGLTLGSLAAFWISRQFRRLVKRWLSRSELYQRFEDLVEHQGMFVCFVLFLFPGFPKDFLCYLLGLSRMPWQAFAVIVFLGRMPGTFMLTLQGAEIYRGNVVGVLVLLAFTAVVVGPAWYYREKIYSWVEAHTIRD